MRWLVLPIVCVVALAALGQPAPAPAKGGKAPAKGAKKGADAGTPDAGVASGPGGFAPTALPSASGVKENPDGGPATAANKKDAAPSEKPPQKFFEGMGSSPQQQAMLDELGKAIEQYEAESKEFKREVQLLVEKKYEDRRNTLADSYERAIRDLEVLERRERLDAIAQFEEFLARYPDDPKYTPDVMFRLAELYYEKSSDDQAIAMREYEEQIKKLDPEKNPTPPPEPKVDFTKSIALYSRLISQFPDYRLLDAAYYLQGYCQEKMEKFEPARDAYLALIAKFPKSKFTIEAWVRIGEYYFDADPTQEKDPLDKAADAYAHATQDKAHPLYDKALYKLGWVYYRQDKFDQGVDAFLALIDFYQDEAKKKKEDVVGGDLRNEAIQYTAVSLVDEKWGSLAKAQELFAKRGGRPYEAEVYRRMGDIYFDQTKHPEAIEAYRLVLQKDPLTKDAPQIQQKIVQAYERDRKLEEAFGESSKLGTMFAVGTPWHEKWKHDPDVITAAAELAEKSLYSTAIYHHQQALAYKQEGKYDQAKGAFETAAKAYDAYLKKFPRSKNAYEMEFYLAECLYNSLQFKEAIVHYAAVRDSSQDVKYQQEAAFSAVLAGQKALELDAAGAGCPTLPVVLSKDWPENKKPTPVPLCDTEKLLIQSSDLYVSKVKQPDEKSPGIAYKAAEIFYKHQMFDEARKRFDAIIAGYPSSDVAQYAVNLEIETYLIEKNNAKVEEMGEKLLALKVNGKSVVDPNSELAKSLTKYKLGGRFKGAEELMAKGEYDLAAQKYLALVAEAPQHEFADKALNNAAVCYENMRRYDSALRLYERIFKEYPKSKLADAALFRVGLDAEQSYDFDKAVDTYQKLVKDYPQSANRENALFNTARLLNAEQRYNEAAAAYLRYADVYPKSDEAPKNIYRAALIYEKQGDNAKEIQALKEFIARFGNDKNQVELIVEAKKRIADDLQKLGKETEAKKAYADAADEFDRRHLKPETEPIAAEAAAFSRFQLAEYDFKEYDKIKIGGSGKALENSLKAKKEAAKKVQAVYDKVIPYKRAEWTLAAFFRKGYSLERLSVTVQETPVPPEVKRFGEEAVAAYQDLLSQATVALEDQAVKFYEETLAEAKKQHIANEWTKKTLESLNRFRPKEYPVLKDPKSLFSGNGDYNDGAYEGLEGRVRGQLTPQKLQGDEK